MTQIQNNRRATAEEARSNKASEKIASARDAEQARSNKAREAETTRANKAHEKETRRSNKAREAMAEKQYQMQKATMLANSAGSVISGLGSAALLAFNDLTFYVPNDEVAQTLVKNRAPLPIGAPVYENNLPKLPSAEITDNTWRFGTVDGYAPTILSIHSTPCIGETFSAHSGIQRATERLFTAVNMKTGRNGNYEAVDIAMEQIGIAGLTMWYGLLTKIYTWSSAYTPDNITLPSAVLTAMQLNPDEIRNGRYEIHAMLEDLKNYINAFALVPEFYLAERWHYAYSHVFMDDSAKTTKQFYQYIPTGIPSCDVLDKVTKIKYIKFLEPGNNGTNTRHGMQHLRDINNALRQSYLAAADIGIMNSDIINAFGLTTLQMPYIEFNAAPTVSTDIIGLAQFANAVFAGSASDVSITQEVKTTGYVSKSVIKATCPTRDGIEFPLDMKSLAPTSANILEVSRLIPMVYPGQEDTDSYSLFVTECPHYLVLTHVDSKVKITSEGSYDDAVGISNTNITPTYAAASTYNMNMAMNSFHDHWVRSTMYLYAYATFNYCPGSNILILGYEGGSGYRGVGMKLAVRDWDTIAKIDASINTERGISDRVSWHMFGGDATSTYPSR